MSKLTNLDHPIGLLNVNPEAGDILITLSGRQTTPYPKFSSENNSQINRSRRDYQIWLMANAVAEAESTGDTFNCRMFAANLESLEKYKTTLPDASVSVAELFVFDVQPRLYKSILDSLDKNAEKVEKEKVSNREIIQGDIFNTSAPDFNPDALLKIAADSWEQLRTSDVARLIDAGVESGVYELDKLISRMIGVRPDLRAEVGEYLIELTAENSGLQIGSVAKSLLTFHEPVKAQETPSENEPSDENNEKLQEAMRLLEELGEEGLIAQKKYGAVWELRRKGLILDEKAKDKKIVENVISEIHKNELDGSNHNHLLKQIIEAKKVLDDNNIEYKTIAHFIDCVESGEIKGARVSAIQDELVKYREIENAVKAGRIHWRVITGNGGSILKASEMIQVEILKRERIVTISPLFDPEITASYLNELSTMIEKISLIEVDVTVNESVDAPYAPAVKGNESVVEKEADPEEKEVIKYSKQFVSYAEYIFKNLLLNKEIPNGMKDQIYRDERLEDNEYNVLLDYAEGKIGRIPDWEPAPVNRDNNNCVISDGDIVYNNTEDKFYMQGERSTPKFNSSVINFMNVGQREIWSDENNFSKDEAVDIQALAKKYASSLTQNLQPFHLRVAKAVINKSFEQLEFITDGGSLKTVKLIEDYADITIGTKPKDILKGLIEFTGIDYAAHSVDKLKQRVDYEAQKVLKKFSNGQEVIDTYRERIIAGYNHLKIEKGHPKVLLNKETNEGYNMSIRGVKFSEFEGYVKAVIAWDSAKTDYDKSLFDTNRVYSEIVNDQTVQDLAEETPLIVDDQQEVIAQIQLPEIYSVCEHGDWITDLSELENYDKEILTAIYNSFEQGNQHITALRVKAIILNADPEVHEELKRLEIDLNRNKGTTQKIHHAERMLSHNLFKMEFPEEVAERILLNVLNDWSYRIESSSDISTVSDKYRMGIVAEPEGTFKGVITKGTTRYVTDSCIEPAAAVISINNDFKYVLNEVYTQSHGIPPVENFMKAIKSILDTSSSNSVVSHVSSNDILGTKILVKVFNENEHDQYYLFDESNHRPTQLNFDQIKSAEKLWIGLKEEGGSHDSGRALTSYLTGYKLLDSLKLLEEKMNVKHTSEFALG